MSGQAKIIKSVGIVDVGSIYTVGDGYHKGSKILIEWICPQKQVQIGNNIMCRQVHGRLLNSSKKINTVLEFLQEYIDLKKQIKIKNMSDLDLIRQCKRNNKEAIKEFVRRFKKLPKINAK